MESFTDRDLLASLKLLMQKHHVKQPTEDIHWETLGMLRTAIARNDPDLKEIERILLEMGPGRSPRDFFTDNVSWAVPSASVVEDIATFFGPRPVVSVGAGLGLWERLLEIAGCFIFATDVRPQPSMRNYTFVEQGDSVDIPPGADGLFLSWPSAESPAGCSALTAFYGQCLCYIGEGRGGCTGNSAMFDILEKEFCLMATLPIPRWEGIKDSAYLFFREVRRANPLDQGYTVLTLPIEIGNE